MSAAPAYSRYPERAPRRDDREGIRVVPGRRTRTQSKPLSSNVVFLAKVAIVVAVVLTCVALVRVSLTAAAVSAQMESQTVTEKIEDAREEGVSLEVSQSSLSNPSRVKKEAESLGMAAPASSGIIELEQDVVATDESGALSLSKSVAAASGAED